MKNKRRIFGRLASMLMVIVLMLSMGLTAFAEETAGNAETPAQTEAPAETQMEMLETAPAETVLQTEETAAQTESAAETEINKETETETIEESELESDEEEQISLLGLFGDDAPYVGFADNVYSSPYGVGGVLQFYITPTDTYNAYRRNKATLIANSEVAYCFNYHKPYPQMYDFSTPSYYNKGTSSPSAFKNASQYSSVSADELYKAVISIGLNGYPQDYSGIQARYGLSDSQYRFLTQYAIWTYTDSLELRWDDAHQNIYAYDAVFNVDHLANGGYLTGWSITSTTAYNNLKNAYAELLNTRLPNSIMDRASFINLYLNDSGEYQHLLNVGMKNYSLPVSFILQKKDAKTGEYLAGAQLRVVKGEYPTTPNSIPSGVINWESENEPEDFALEENVVYTLIETKVPSGYQVADNIVFMLKNGSLYVKKDGAWSAADPFGRGNLITVTNRPILEMQDAPIAKNRELSLTKKVTGNVGERERAFEFTITLRQSSGQAVTGNFEVVPSGANGVQAPQITSLTFDANGTAKVKLMHGQTITIKNLPDGYSYEIKENMQGLDGYYVTVEQNNSAGSNVHENTAVTFINEKNAVPTGINLDIQSYVCAMLLAVVAGLLFILKKFLL